MNFIRRRKTAVPAATLFLLHCFIVCQEKDDK